MPLERFDVHAFPKGWFIGDFSPTLLKTDAVEVALKEYRAGDRETAHHHKIATEFTLLVSGEAVMAGELVRAGEIIRVAPGQSVDFAAVTDVTTVVVKLPSIAGDKYLD